MYESEFNHIDTVPDNWTESDSPSYDGEWVLDAYEGDGIIAIRLLSENAKDGYVRVLSGINHRGETRSIGFTHANQTVPSKSACKVTVNLLLQAMDNVVTRYQTGSPNLPVAQNEYTESILPTTTRINKQWREHQDSLTYPLKISYSGLRNDAIAIKIRSSADGYTVTVYSGVEDRGSPRKIAEGSPTKEKYAHLQAEILLSSITEIIQRGEEEDNVFKQQAPIQ